MIRALAQAASADYDRWYILAHSLGTIVAFNGLMESSYAWPGYFDEDTWKQLVKDGFAGPARAGWMAPAGRLSPRRPLWSDPNHIAYRSAIFEKLHGVLMMGSPLEKFATLWPGRVPISNEPAFRRGTAWVCIYDPLDPVSGVLRAFDTINPQCSPQPETIGYASDLKLLISHIRYLRWRPGGGTLADGVAEWLITGQRRRIASNAGSRWFSFVNTAPTAGWPTPAPNSSRHRRRTVGAWLWWIFAVFVLTLFGSLAIPPLYKAIAGLISATASHVVRLIGLDG